MGLERSKLISASEQPLNGRVFLAGAGRVGTAVAVLLARSGHEVVGVASRSQASARRAGDLLGAPIFDLYEGDLPAADIWLIGAGDAAIGSVATSLAGRASSGVAVHLAGSFGTEPLGPLTGSGCAAAALHPVQACPDIETALRRLPGSAWGVTTTPGLAPWAKDLVSGPLAGHPHLVAEDDRPVWHAASVITSNGIAALLAFAESLLTSIGEGGAIDVLGPLAAGTVQNAREGGGGAETLTGPIVRSESATVARHLEALRTDEPALAERYAEVGALILESARRAGRINEVDAASIEEALAQWR